MKDDDTVSITRGTYKGFSSRVMENRLIRLETVPEIGGKLVSLLYKPAGKEWLLDSGSRPLRVPEKGTAFGDGDMSGWDECFPTVNSCRLQGTPEVSLPDHGELWPLPWDCRIAGDRLVSSVQSPQLPYRFTREISFSAEDRIRLDYRAGNTGDQPLPFLWVPHPQFAVTEPTRILLPAGVEDMLCVFPGRTLEIGTMYSWDEHSLILPAVTGDGRKYYYPGRVPAGCSGLYGEASGSYLLVSVPPDKVPYIGVWVDEGMFNDRVTCALEPGIGYYDSLERAAGNGTAERIPAASSCSWHMELTFGEGIHHIAAKLRREGTK
ncbi:hypothetical protein [Paenibacillus sp. MMS20-IR301]|uniref:hypothetical protein n=1 Tax=Paenibacillus sp. MMS20-IR301 TaxID=2895946 RepID=UPI0028EFBA66|nr:hypothetical protein [Paenibacillus sp. MMS20-IR301]WNS40717.1 hypothetical protein LOS79_16790 [Paenibacillus sp. MMS20-IR301]